MFAEVLLITTITAVFLTLIIKLLKHFGRGIDLAIYFAIPLLIYGVGYTLRLSGQEQFIDLGYYMTDSSFMFVYSVFAISMLLGQLKYWKK